jgi:hypothetical protein
MLPQGQTKAVPPATPYVELIEVPDKQRLAITPRIDGVRANEEWDPFARVGAMDAYFQWEPGKLHLAAKLPKTHDAVYSFDLAKNGWLIGRDNLEIRLTKTESGATVKARLLDATNSTGPQWVELQSLATSSSVAGSEDADTGTWFVEATIEEPGLDMFPKDPARMSLRADPIARDASDREAFLPRVTTDVQLGFDRATGLPEALKWKPEGAGQTVTSGFPVNIRLTFQGKGDMGLQRIDMRSEGQIESMANAFGLVFPKFDSKGRAFVDYKTEAAQNMGYGYKVMRATMTFEDGAAAVGQVSFRIAPVLEFDLVSEPIKTMAETQTVRMSVFIRSNTRNRVDGTLRILPPSNFKLGGVSGKSFVIYNSRGAVRRVFDLTVPKDAKGTFPFSLQGELGDRTVAQTVYVTIR